MTADMIAAVERAALALLDREPVGQLHWADAGTRYAITTSVLDHLDATGTMSWHLGEVERGRCPFRPLFDPQTHYEIGACSDYRPADHRATNRDQVDCLSCLDYLARVRETRLFGQPL